MRKLIIAVALILTSITAWSQGLDGIVVEKYYVSNAADAAGSIGTLPTGSVTWRIYADLASGYKLQAVYGVAAHPLVFNTSTTFFNNEDRGSYIPNWTKAQAAGNTIMLDSYLTLGSVVTPGTTSEFGVLKTEDNTTGNIINSNGILQNNDPSAGIPLTSRDGFLAGSTQNIQLVGITPANLSMFDNTSQVGGSFTTNNGSIAALNGANGPTSSNRVLIAQLTTTGIVHYEVNLQIINTATGVVSNYVASNPTGTEQTNVSLIGNLGVTLAAEPTAVGALTFGATASTNMALNFTSGNGAKRIVIGRAGLAVTSGPIDGSTYTANAAFGQGSQIGSGNFVVYNGSGSSVTVTGLNPSTTYHFRVVEYNDGGQASGENYLTSTVVTGSNATTATGTTYTWNQTGPGPFDWTTAANWTPTRTIPAQDDILLFNNGAASLSINNVPTQSVGRLSITNNTNITLNTTGASTLTIRGVVSATDDLGVGAGSSLNLTGTSPVNISLLAGATSVISGAVTLATTNRLTGTTLNAIRFKAGSSCTLTPNYSGGPFGTPATNANTIIFESGSTYTHNSGDNPFQRAAPSSIVVFSSGSQQVWNSSLGFDASGRTYGNLTIGGVINVPLSGAFAFGSMTINAGGQITINGTANSSITMRGGIVNNSSNFASLTAGSGGITAAISSNLIGISPFEILATNGGTFTIPSGVTVTTNQNVTLNNLNLIGNVNFTAPATWSFNGSISGTGLFNSTPSYCANLNFLPSSSTMGNFKTGANALNNLTYNRTGITSTLTNSIVVWGAITMTDGTIASNGNIRLGSNALRQGIISGAGAGIITGNVTVDRYVPSPGNGNSPSRMISCPVSGLTTNTAWGDDFIVKGTAPYTYNPSAPPAPEYPTIWSYDDSNIAPETQYESANGASIDPMDGFYANLGTFNNYLLDVTGPVNNGALTTTLPSTNNGVHFVGNPYPSPIRWSILRNLSGQVGLQSSYYGWSATNNAWGYFNGTIGTFNLNDTIPLGQAFSVTTNTTAGGNLIMNNSIRHGSISAAFSRLVLPEQLVKLSINGETGKDQLAVYSISGGIDQFNPESDAVKIDNGPDEKAPQISMVFTDQKFAIKELNTLSGKIIPLTVQIREAGEYSLSIAEAKGIDGLKMQLTDRLLGKSVKIKEGQLMTVTLEAGIYNNRFFLEVPSNGANSDGLNELIGGNIFERVLTVTNGFENAVNATIEILDMSGKVVFSTNDQIAVGYSQINLPIFADGLYLLKIQAANQVSVKKVVIQ